MKILLNFSQRKLSLNESFLLKIVALLKLFHLLELGSSKNKMFQISKHCSYPCINKDDYSPTVILLILSIF